MKVKLIDAFLGKLLVFRDVNTLLGCYALLF